MAEDHVDVAGGLESDALIAGSFAKPRISARCPASCSLIVPGHAVKTVALGYWRTIRPIAC